MGKRTKCVVIRFNQQSNWHTYQCLERSIQWYLQLNLIKDDMLFAGKIYYDKSPDIPYT